MRFNKRNGLLKWSTQLNSITRVQSVVSVGSDEFFLGCGQNNYGDRSVANGSIESEAWLFRINYQGKIQWLMKVAGDKPLRGSKSSDNCLALTYDLSNGQATALIQTKSPQLRTGS